MGLTTYFSMWISKFKYFKYGRKMVTTELSKSFATLNELRKLSYKDFDHRLIFCEELGSF